MPSSDTNILRELGRQAAEAAAHDVNAQTVALWKRLNGLQPARPMIMLDQLPWNELNSNGELDLRCTDPFLRAIEGDLRRRLYRFRHCRGDFVLHPYVAIPKVVRTEPELHVAEETLATDPTNSVVSHQYVDQLPDEDALAKIVPPTLIPDPSLDRQHLETAHAIFDGILDVRLVGPAFGYGVYGGMWDQITCFRSAEHVLYDLADRPEFCHRLIDTFVRRMSHIVDQYESLGLLDVDGPLVHCTGAYTDELPAADYDGKTVHTRDVWIFGLGQVFSTVSPAMHDEFEIQPMKPLLERFGLCYYGCCDPLDRKIHIVRQIKNVRKISISPWADPERAASQIGPDYVFSAKPNPALVARDTFDADLVRRELAHIVTTCRQYRCPCELILKDVSTVRHQPQRLTAWERIAREVATEDA